MPKAAPPISADLRGTLSEATEALRRMYGDRLNHLILYGSEARGEAGPESDVDVLVVLDGPVNLYEEAKRTSSIAVQAASHRDTALSFVHLSVEEFEDGRRPLVQSVREDGIDLLKTFSRDEARSQEGGTGR